ncbi:hypothetical protein BKA04_001370 [Cryobacterium mesophilum]|uniref:DNA helicase n=1 Tax=Terrimesophilobacter mesophilus TaxID=433647 RepID=A0A4R8VCS2_9MICO|nr:hypothetical protein [Terrimesophilobacter mesophilus]MBB5633147.1 hypothetical protein [Terrimesophilobacter mesophilus]TFB79902.1 hypothetical protein E3N84_07500 [Terrimesophilobacter mesophilus]
MGLSRKRQRELNRLKRGASELWDDQRDVLDHATKVVKEARRQLSNVSREEFVPRVRDLYESRVRPGVETGLEVGRNVAGAARDKVSRDVLPAVSSALGTALAALEVARSPQVRQALSRVARSTSKTVAPAKPSSGPGRYILIGVGLVAAAGVAYAAWQTLRADDELWVSDEPEPPTSD